MSTVILKSVAEGLRHKYLTIGWAGDVSPHSKNIHICARERFWRLCNFPIYCNISNDGYKKRKGVWPAQVTIGKLNCKKRHRSNLNTGKRKNKQKTKISTGEERGENLGLRNLQTPCKPSHQDQHLLVIIFSYFHIFDFFMNVTRWLHVFHPNTRNWKTRSSWLNCALRADEAVYWVSIGHYCMRW